ncbi:MAG: hypothetical protein Kow0081_4270 [Candidatus Dojkabacteria bacterium]
MKHLNLLIGINVLIFAAYTLLVSLTGANPREQTELSIVLFGAFSPILVELGMIWIMITSNFLHIGIFHLVINMLALFQLGQLVETFYSSRKVLITYVLSGLTGSIFTYLWALLTDEKIFLSIGASGAIFGLLGLLVGGTLKSSRYTAALPFSIQDFYPTIFLAIIISFFPNINWMAHLGGFLAGFALSYVFKNSYLRVIPEKEETQEKLVEKISFGIIAISYLLLAANFFFEIIKIPINLL